MFWNKTLLTLFAAFAIANAYISNIAVDVPNGQIYITEGNVLYEVDNVHLQQNNVHFTSGATDFGPLFITRRSNNKRVLFSFENMDTTNELVYYPLPLKNQNTLIPSDSLAVEKGLSLGSTFDNTDKIAILSVSRNLTLIDLTSLTVMDTFTYWVGSRIFGRNVVYNHQTNRVTIFRSRVPIRGNYGLDVNEYSIASGTFEEVQSTYNCLCDEGHNLTASPFYKAIVSDCEIDYSTTPAKIWCAVPEQKKFFSFMAANLSDFQVIHTSASFDSIAWDFVGRLAYGIKSNTAGFSVYKINLNNGQTVQTYTNSVINIDSSVYQLDPNEPQLYLSVDGQSKILSLSTNNFSTLKSITLTPPSP